MAAVGVGGSAVAARQLAGSRDRLAVLGSGERLGESRVRVTQFAFRLQLRCNVKR